MQMLPNSMLKSSQSSLGMPIVDVTFPTAHPRRSRQQSNLGAEQNEAARVNALAVTRHTATMAAKTLDTIVSLAKHALRKRRTELHCVSVTSRRSLVTRTLPRRAIDHQVVDDNKAYPPSLLQSAGPRPLKHVEKKEETKPLSHAYGGMTGGQIFHEMMLQHGVKYICMFPLSRYPRLTDC